MTTNETNNSTFGDVIYQYTRAQAIEDGILIDVTETAREAGITFPTAVTAAVWERCVTVPEKAPWPGRDGPAVGCADAAAVHAIAEPRRQPSQLHRGSPERRTTPPAGATQSPLRTGRLRASRSSRSCSPKKIRPQAAAAAPQPPQRPGSVPAGEEYVGAGR